jgi:hypothetical protein
MDRLGLLRQEDGAHAALADPFEQFVGANRRAKILSCGSTEEGVKLPGRRFQEGSFLVMHAEQGFYALSQFAVFAARLQEVCA